MDEQAKQILIDADIYREMMHELVELKRFTSNDYYQRGRKDGYSDAIYEFKKKINSRKKYFEEYYPNDVIAIAEANAYLEIAKIMDGSNGEITDSYRRGREDAINEFVDSMKKFYFEHDIQSAKDDPCVIDAMIDLAIRTAKEVKEKT